jgi:hypothetical protein
MYGRILTISVLAAHSAGVSTAAGRQLRDLVMPDAKVLAGLNMDRVKSTALGRYVLTQLAQRVVQIHEASTFFGFDPSRNVHELLFASSGTSLDAGGILVARGRFDGAAMRSKAEQNGGTTETYRGATILLDTKKTIGLALLSSTIAAAGDVASVKAVIDREAKLSSMTSALSAEVSRWSAAGDFWVISMVPPLGLMPGSAPANPGGPQNLLKNLQRAAAGIRFRNGAEVTTEAQADTSENASTLGNALKFLANMAQAQASKKGAPAAALPLPEVKTQGATLNISATLTDSQFRNLLPPKKQPAGKKL